MLILIKELETKTTKTHKNCNRCDSLFSTKHIKERKTLKTKCSNCKKIGHLAKVCQQKNVNCVDNTEEQEEDTKEITELEAYQLNIWKVQLLHDLPKFTAVKNDFKKNLFNNCLVKILIDTAAKVSVCDEQQAELWGIYDKMKPSFAKTHPYDSAPIKVTGTAICSVNFKNWAVPVEFYILPGSCDPILDGNKAEELKIISLDKDDNHIFNSVLMITSQEKDGEVINNICLILKYYPQNVIDAISDAIDNTLKEGVTEEHPINGPSPWVSCAVMVPKTDVSVRITLDAS